MASKDKPDDPYREMHGEHLAADEDADRAVPVGRPVDTTSPYVPHIPGFSPGISHGDDTGDMGPRSGVNPSADAGSPSAPESIPEGDRYEPPHMPQGLGVGERDRGLGRGGGYTANPGPPKKPGK